MSSIAAPSPNQVDAAENAEMTDALQKAEEMKAKANANARADALSTKTTATPLPALFLTMPETKLQQSQAFTRFSTLHQMLTSARADLAHFEATCTKRSPMITLPLPLRGNYSKAHFDAVDGNAAFYKEITDALQTLEQTSAKEAFALIVKGKTEYINHLESLVATSNFIGQAVTSYSAFVVETNRLYASRGSSIIVPLDAAVTQFRDKLRPRMELFIAEQVQAELTAARKKTTITVEETKAEERLLEGAHNGTAIAEIASKTVKAELVHTQKQLTDALRGIQDLQEKYNRFEGAAPVKTKGQKRKQEHSQPEASSNSLPLTESDPNAMSDIPFSIGFQTTPTKQSNVHGGGRPHPMKRPNTGRNGGGKTAVKGQANTSSQTRTTNPTIGWQRFSRTLAARFLFTDKDQQQHSRIREKFRLKGRHSHLLDQLEASHQSDDLGLDLRFLNQYRNVTFPILERAAEVECHRTLSKRYRVNIKLKEIDFIRSLVENVNITCKPADKNLGLVLVDTEWYVTELRRMLGDRVTYSIVPSGAKPTITFTKLQDRLLTELHQLAKKHRNTIQSYDPIHCDLIVSFLLHRITKSGDNAAVIPTIYGIVKVHKPRLSMRPIVPCTKSVTTPASIVVDELLQRVLRDAKVSWIVKDTKSLIVDLESHALPTQDGVFVTADIASLYTNIDTDDGLITIDAFLHEQLIDTHLRRLIMDLLTFVMRNSYLQFRDTVYKQIDGTAMGTACAPTYANIYVYMKERIILTEMIASIRLYRRFLDDIFAFIAEAEVEDFKRRMNRLHPKLKFEFVTHSTEAVFLDLLIHKGTRFYESSIVDLRVHQKSMNLYLYIPWTSFHTDAAKRSFIQTELMRYVRNSSNRQDYLQLKRVFYGRLRDRGYPRSFLRPLFTDAVLYEDRHYFLYPSVELMHHPTVFSHPPKSTCLLKRIARAEVVGSGAAEPPVFVTSDNPLTRAVPIRKTLMQRWSILHAVNPNLPPPIIAYQTYPSLATVLVFQKAKRNEESRLEKFQKLKATIQTRMDSHMQRLA